MNITNIWKNESRLLDATGMLPEEAEELLVDFSSELNLSNVGRPTKLDDRGVFLLLMLYFRHYPTFDLLGLMFEMDTSNAQRWVNRAEKALRSVLSKKNFSHLIAPCPERTSRKPLSDSTKSILTALSNQYGGQYPIKNNAQTTLERKNDTRPNAL